MTIKNLNMRWATRSVRPAAVAGLALAALGVSACGSATAREGQASSYLVILNLEASATGTDEFDHVLASDVRTNGGIIEDDGRVQMSRRPARRDQRQRPDREQRDHGQPLPGHLPPVGRP